MTVSTKDISMIASYLEGFNGFEEPLRTLCKDYITLRESLHAWKDVAEVFKAEYPAILKAPSYALATLNLAFQEHTLAQYLYEMGKAVSQGALLPLRPRLNDRPAKPLSYHLNDPMTEALWIENNFGFDCMGDPNAYKVDWKAVLAVARVLVQNSLAFTESSFIQAQNELFRTLEHPRWIHGPQWYKKDAPK